MTDRNGAHQEPQHHAVVPKHVAIIMDGNGRWARKRLLPRIEGHRVGAKSVRMVVEEARRVGIRYLTLFAFSTENWQRPKEEVSSLMKLLYQYLESELQLLLQNDIRLRAIGELTRLPDFVQSSLAKSIENTAQMQGMDLILAVSYGGRQELVHAARNLSEQVLSGKLLPTDINENLVTSQLYAPDVPDPDLLIRTSDENRISNFMLWQLAYSELIVTSALWPEFTREEFHRCLEEYARRSRRFGLTEEQVNGSQTA